MVVSEGVGCEGSLPERLGVVDGEHDGLDEVLDRVHPSLFVLLEPLVRRLGARAAAVAADQLPTPEQRSCLQVSSTSDWTDIIGLWGRCLEQRLCRESDTQLDGGKWKGVGARAC